MVHRATRRRAASAVVGAALAALAVASPGLAQTEAQGGAQTGAGAPSKPDTDPVASLRAEIEQLRHDYETRMSELEARLAALEAAGAPSAGPPKEAPPQAAQADQAPPADELAALRAAAAAASAEVAQGAPKPGPAGRTEPEAPVYGRERNLNQLNPEISMTGNVLGVASDAAREEWRVQEFELDVQSPLDPFSMTHWTVAFSPDEGASIEEGYVKYPTLASGVGLTVGKFRQQLGLLNRWHLHALPQTDYPLVLQSYFGEEGLSQTGVSVGWLIPHGWATTNQLTLQVTDGSNEAFGGEDFRRLAVLGHLSSYWDLSDATYLELGLSGIDGETAEGGRSRVWGADLTLDWTPPARAKYRELTWRTEVLRSERADPAGLVHDAWGGFTYLEGLLARNLWAGVRYDRVEDPLAPDRAPGYLRKAIVPYVTWWQSELVRLHGEYRRLEDDLADKAANSFSLQLVWAAGPHKHEKY